MSRNFELLQKADKVGKLIRPQTNWVADSPAADAQQVVPQFHPRDEANKLVQRIFSPQGTPGPRVVVFTGIGDGSGTGAICAMVAEALAARAIGTVCAVDSHFRMPSLHVCFEIQNHEGLADGLMHSGPIRPLARQIASSNLWLLSCGSGSLNNGPMAAVDRLAFRLQELRDEFDYVLVHAGAADIYPDAIALGKAADGVILVVEAGTTAREAVQKAKLNLENAGVPLLGAVLNNRTFPIPQSLYRRLK